MKQRLRPLVPALFLCLGTFVTPPLIPSANAAVEISFSYFQDSLSPYGEWVEVDGYGTAWHPLQVDPEWSPYQEGSWVYTDAGWTWTSEEPWADVVYHYGRWVYTDGYGWCWVPGYEWAPAWVSWRSNDDYVGWAPLPPEARWEPSVGFSVWTDSHYDIGPRYYRFCHVRDFCEPDIRRHCRPWRENVNYMNLTVNITNINYDYDNRRVFVGGPRLAYLRGRTNSPIRELRLVEDDGFRRNRVRGDEFVLARANVAADPDFGRERFRERAVRTIGRDRVDHGWRDFAKNDTERQAMRERVREQVRGLTPENKKAVKLAKTEGGVARSELQAKTDPNAPDRRAIENRTEDRPPGPRGDEPNPRVGTRPGDRDERERGQDAKKGDDVRKGMPAPTQEDLNRINRERGKGEDRRPGQPEENRRIDDPNRERGPGRDGPPGIDNDVRRGLPVPPEENRRPGPQFDDRPADRGREGDTRGPGKGKADRSDEVRRPLPPGDTPAPGPRPGADQNEGKPKAKDNPAEQRGPNRNEGAKKSEERPEVRKVTPEPIRPQPRIEDRPPGASNRERDEGTTRPPEPQRKVTPKPSSARPEMPKREPSAPKPPPSVQRKAPAPQTERPSAPPRVKAPEQPRPQAVPKRVEKSAPRPPQASKPPPAPKKVQQAPPQPKPKPSSPPPQVQRRPSPPPAAPRPQPSGNRSGGGNKKQDEKKEKR